MSATRTEREDSAEPTAAHRNVVVMLSDDHAQWALGAYGNSEIDSASIDALSATGVRFDNAYTPTPVCSPARASFWTGRLPSQHGVHDYLAEADPEVAAVGWLKGETTLAARFKAAGYTTAMIGKWHLGPRDEEVADFDYWFNQVGPLPAPSEFASGSIEPPVSIGDGRFDRHAITDHAINFLRRREPDKPFFLFIGHFATHSPWVDQPERLVERYRTCTFDDVPADAMYPFGRPTAEALYPTRDQPRETLAQYYGAVSLIDEQIGRVVDELEAQGLRESTLVVYTADHGLNAGHHGLWGKGNATYPYNMLDESIRIPLIVNAPGHVLPRQRRTEPATLCDLHDTVLDFAGLAPDDGERERLRLPGRSLLPLCRAQVEADWPDAVFGEYGDLRMIRTGTHKLVRRYGANRGELFDLIADPRETTNLLGDPMYADIEAELDDRLARYFEQYEDAAASGLRVSELPRHNRDEAWREDGVSRLVATADWMARSAEESGS